MSIQPRTATWLEIDLDALAHNIAALRQIVGDPVALFPVVKANAYGHGAVPVAHAALDAGCAGLCVARLDEGIALREAGIRAPIWLLGWIPPEQIGAAVEYRLTPTINSMAQAAMLQATTPRGHQVSVHVKVDTGLSRYGLLPDEVVSFVHRLRTFDRLRLDGLWTHMARADEADPAPTQAQLRRFTDVLHRLREHGVAPRWLHTAASAAILNPALARAAHFNAVRPGISIYGLPPSHDVEWPIHLRPVLSWKARVARVRRLPAGTAISYGGTFVTPKPMRVALVPVGYGDGYPRALSNRGRVLIRGKRCRIVGRVCMDNIVVDVDHLDQVEEGDEVVLIGQQGHATITADDLATLLDTINYEIVSQILPRVPRFYI
nr:alanine racemase [Ardenticatena sp.]